MILRGRPLAHGVRIILAQLIEDRGAHIAAPDGDLNEGEHQRGPIE
jgi:hypothetical protein